jgi:hypothetical protein
MFIITERWLVTITTQDFDTGIAGKYLHSNKKRQNGWSFIRDIEGYYVSDSKEDALLECSVDFYADKAETLIGMEFDSAEEAHNYVFACFAQWWYGLKRDSRYFKNKKLSVSERTIGDYDISEQGVMEMKTEWKDLMNKIESFALSGSSDDAFFFQYMLLTDEQKNSFWSEDRKKVNINGRWVARQTFYNHIRNFKTKLEKTFAN